MSIIIYGGLDVHKESITAYLFCPDTGEILSDRVPNEREHVVRAAKRWSKLGELRLCYEASGAGFVLKRWLKELGVSCDVIAPSLIPKAPGNHTKTDQRDAKQLALLYRAGLLQVVRAPSEQEERVRALLRLREDLTRDIVRAKNRTVKYLRTLGHQYGQGKNWTQKHRRWLKELELGELERLIVETYVEGLDELVKRQGEIDQKIHEIAQTDVYQEKVNRLMSLKGIGLYSAMVLLAEIGDVSRFAKPNQLMAYLGLASRESSSGEKHRTGSITKAGNNHARWILGEAAWNQMPKPGNSDRMKRHWRDQPKEVVEIGKKAEKRLHKKFWGVASRKDRKTAAIAVAREMAGFVWAILNVEAA